MKIEKSSIPVKRLPASLTRLRQDSFRKEVRQAITSMPRPAIILDLSATVKLDATGIGFVIRCARDAAEYDAEVAIVASNPEHRVLFEVIQLTRVVPAFCTVEEAADYLGKSDKPAVIPKVSVALDPDSSPVM
jgi:anti-anti-sigma regulatory factor